VSEVLARLDGARMGPYKVAASQRADFRPCRRSLL